MRLIDADALKESIKEWKYHGFYDKLIEVIDNAPTVERPTIYEFKGCDNCELDRPTGEWIEVKDKFAYGTYYHWDCSVCKTQYGKTYNFCPNCGARMEAENE